MYAEPVHAFASYLNLCTRSVDNDVIDAQQSRRSTENLIAACKHFCSLCSSGAVSLSHLLPLSLYFVILEMR